VRRRRRRRRGGGEEAGGEEERINTDAWKERARHGRGGERKRR
jgi:hypothetical protein